MFAAIMQELQRILFQTESINQYATLSLNRRKDKRKRRKGAGGKKEEVRKMLRI